VDGASDSRPRRYNLAIPGRLRIQAAHDERSSMGQLRMVGAKPMIAQALEGAGVELEAKGGHTTLEYGPQAKVSDEQAREVFIRLQEMEFKAYAGPKGTAVKEPIEVFDPQAEEITLMPAMAGGRL
jgi:hypothetical protein